MTQMEIEDQVKAYAQNRHNYEAFAQTLKSLFSQLLAGKPLEVANIEARAKSVESFRAKIEREDNNYSDPINQITDLAGLRIITYQLEDVALVSELIEQNLKIDREHSVDKLQSLEADRFGYVSVHYIVRLQAPRDTLPEYAAFSQLSGEIQVRTVLQHAWAAIDHKLLYKSKMEIPAKLRRQLFRVSALLELADEEFESLRSRIAEVRAEIKEAVSKGSLDISLSTDSLGVYIDESANARKIRESSEELEIEIAPHHPNAKFPEYSHLLAFLELAKASTIQDFDNDLATTSAKATAVLKEIVEHWRTCVAMPGLRLVVTRDSLFKMAYFLALPPERATPVLSALRFRPALRGSVEKVYRTLHNAPDFTIAAQSDPGSDDGRERW